MLGIKAMLWDLVERDEELMNMMEAELWAIIQLDSKFKNN